MHRLASSILRGRHSGSSRRRLWTTIAPVISVAMTTTAFSSPLTALEQEETSTADPYDNLPDEDEETHCEICKINRRGPCRPLWRKFEACMKDHPPESSSSGGDAGSGAPPGPSICDKYMMDWIPCVQENRMLYLLFNNQVFQEERLEEIEEAFSVRKEAIETPKPDAIDMTSFLEYTTTKSESTTSGSSEYPAVVEVTIEGIPIHYEGLQLELVYATSEITGTVHGFEYMTREKEERASSGDLKLYLTLDTPIGDIVVYKIYKEVTAAEEQQPDESDSKNEADELQKDPVIKVLKSKTKKKFPLNWNKPRTT